MVYKRFLEYVKGDLTSWCSHYKKHYSFKTFLFFFKQYPEFRVQFKTRLKLLEKGGWWWVKLLRYPLELSVLHLNIFIYTEAENIGKGLIFHHGFSTMVSANTIGENCHIYQQVTIGNEKGGCPTIGNNVIIYAGAKVIGGISIGDDVVIGANSVVTKDIPSHSIVVGIPARIIKTRNRIGDDWLSK